MHARWHSGLMAVALVCAMVSLVTAADVAGTYSCRGANANGSPYAGTVEIKSIGDGYLLNWNIGGQGHSGTAILMDDQLSSTWGTNGVFGIVVYKVEDDGTLVGKWLNPGGGAFGTETLTPQ